MVKTERDQLHKMLDQLLDEEHPGEVGQARGVLLLRESLIGDRGIALSHTITMRGIVRKEAVVLRSLVEKLKEGVEE